MPYLEDKKNEHSYLVVIFATPECTLRELYYEFEIFKFA